MEVSDTPKSQVFEPVNSLLEHRQRNHHDASQNAIDHPWRSRLKLRRLNHQPNNSIQPNYKLNINYSAHVSKKLSDLESSLQRIVNFEEQQDKKLDQLSRKLELVASAVGVLSSSCEEDEHKRLKERLKEAMETESLNERAQLQHKENWIEYFFGICEANARIGREGSRLIHPHSRFMQGMMLSSGILLFYTAIIVPVQICLWDYDDPCQMFPTLCFDTVVDTFFLVEAFIQFFVGNYHADMSYNDEWRDIARAKLLSWSGFWFDCTTSIPWSYVDLHFYLACITSQEKGSSNSGAKAIRVVKILRILRIVRILKLVKFIVFIEDYGMMMFGSAVFKIGRLLTFVTLSIHLFACVFYRLKKEFSQYPDDMESFLISKHVNPSLVCFYFVLTTFSTVGYGDIVPTSREERAYCVFLFLAAASLFGTLISQLNEIVVQQSAFSNALDSVLESYLVLRPKLDMTTMFKVRGWERYQFQNDYIHVQQRNVLERNLPQSLKLTIAKKIESNLYSKVPFLTGIRLVGEIRALFAAELVLKSELKNFARGSIIASSRERSTGLMVIASGQVGAELPLEFENAEDTKSDDNAKTLLYVFGRGDCIGGNEVVGDLRWAGSYGVNADFIARTHCSVEFIRTEQVLEILNKIEFFPIKCRVQRAAEIFQRHRAQHEISRVLGRESGGRALARGNTKVVFFWSLLARQISLYFDAHPQHRPPLIEYFEELPPSEFRLSDEERDRIREMFYLFDFDGGGSIDQRELACAMYALGFDYAPNSTTPILPPGMRSMSQRRKAEPTSSFIRLRRRGSGVENVFRMLERSKSARERLQGDRKTSMNLEDFTSLMDGQLTGRDPMEEIRTTFAALCGPHDAINDTGSERLIGPHITLAKLRRACKQFHVRLMEEELKIMIDGADKNCDGTVDQREYVEILCLSPWY